MDIFALLIMGFVIYSVIKGQKTKAEAQKRAQQAQRRSAQQAADMMRAPQADSPPQSAPMQPAQSTMAPRRAPVLQPRTTSQMSVPLPAEAAARAYIILFVLTSTPYFSPNLITVPFNVSISVFIFF